MARALYDFLVNSFLFNEEDIEEEYARIAQRDWELEVSRYVDYMVANAGVVADEIVAGNAPSTFSLLHSSFARLPAVAELKQSLLYFDRVLISAPLFFPNDRVLAAKDARYMKDMTPMVAAGALFFVPLGAWPGEGRERSVIEASRQPLEVRVSDAIDTWLTNPVLPNAPDALRSVVSALRKSMTELFVHEMLQDLPRAQLSKSMLAPSLQFHKEILRISTEPGERGELEIGQLALRLELPVVQSISVSDLMNVRAECYEAFRDFQVVLRQKLAGLRDIGDPVHFAHALEDIQRELTEQQVREVDKELRRVKRTIRNDAMLAVAGVTAALYAGPTTPLGLLLQATSAKKVADVISAVLNVRGPLELPGYFLWKLARSAS
jgi:hypothetical protein